VSRLAIPVHTLILPYRSVKTVIQHVRVVQEDWQQTAVLAQVLSFYKPALPHAFQTVGVVTMETHQLINAQSAIQAAQPVQVDRLRIVLHAHCLVIYSQ